VTLLSDEFGQVGKSAERYKLSFVLGYISLYHKL